MKLILSLTFNLTILKLYQIKNETAYKNLTFSILKKYQCNNYIKKKIKFPNLHYKVKYLLTLSPLTKQKRFF